MLVSENTDETKILKVKSEVLSKMQMDKEQDDEEVNNQILDLIWNAIDGTMKPEQLLQKLTEKKKNIEQFESLVADVINIIDIEIGSYGTNQSVIFSSSSKEAVNPVTKREKFYSIINHLRPFLGDELLKERLEIETLESLKLIVKKEAFNKQYIKIKTRLFYKQQKFNLIREESEGYSKLITELGQTKLNVQALENIQSLIGCFNLDPNRVLDIILESFENNPTMNQTFINLLKIYKAEDETICQIIGFKFQALNEQENTLQQEKNIDLDSKSGIDQQTQQDFHFYQLHNVQFKNSLLYTVTAYLLKYEMIDLDSLMPHMYPNEVDTTKFYKEEFEAARQYAKKLTMVNLSETNSSNDKNSKEYNPVDYQQQHRQNQAEELKKIMHTQLNRLENQKVSVVKALIEIEDYKNAIRIIEKLPHWYLATYPDISFEICKAIDQNILDPIYKKCNSLSNYLKEKYIINSKTKSNKLSNNDINKKNLDEMLGVFVESILPILSALGPGISYNTIVFTKLIRISVAFIETHNLSATTSSEQVVKESSQPSQNGSSNPNTQTKEQVQKIVSPAENISKLTPNQLAFYNQIYIILNDVLMPSLGMISMNPCLAIELWKLLSMFPYEMRYFLYNNLRQYSYKHFPQLIRTKAECQEKIKYLLKRLTKENVKIHGRQIGKLSHNNPIIVCDFIITQIQRYDNFILPIVDSLKFLTPLSYDILSYCTIIAISDAEKDKMKHDSTNISSWLRSVATFCALAFKKYPIELTAIIQYVINQLKVRKSYDLLILQEIVQKMCGIEVLSEVNDLQLEAMSGGDILRQEAGYYNPIRNIKKCANRLKEALADHGLILPLCILLSQQRDYIVFTDSEERQNYSITADKQHLKLTGSLYDQCQDSLVQFSQFLSSTLTTEEYIHIFPNIDDLVSEYHMSADVAFFLSRPMYAHHIQSKYDELRRMDRNIKSVEKPSKTQRYLEAIDCVMQPVIDLCLTLHSSKVWEDMSPLFYTTFWTLSMNDCFVPTAAYDKQKAILKQKFSALDDNMDLTTTKKKKEKEKLLGMLDKLTEEENKQRDHVQHVKARFEKEKEHWFPQKNKTKNETITVFLQLCIFSRCLFTQIDAYYSAKFIQIIHSLKTPNFSTIICYDRIFSDISYSIASLTDNEARKYGRFLLGLLETVMSWHSDSAVFEAECASFPGFLTVFRNALNTQTAATNTTNKQEQLDYENFRHVCHKWHYKLTKSFIVCLESEEYLQMRNSLIILTKILPHYPRLTGFCTALEKRVEKIKLAEKDRKQDISTLALVYLGQLKQRKPHMVDESKFHLKEVKANVVVAKPATDIKPNKDIQSSKQASDGTKLRQQSNSKESSVTSIQKTGTTSKQATDNLKLNTTPTTTVSASPISPPKSLSDYSKGSNNSTLSNKFVSSNGSSLNTTNGSGLKENGNSSRPSTPISKNSSPPSSKTFIREESSRIHREDREFRYSSNRQEGSKRGNSNMSPSSSQSSQNHSDSRAQLTPSRKKNDFSPTSSVSSEELPSSPKRSQSGSQNRYKSHSRSSSPKGSSSNKSYASDKTKRIKSGDDSSQNNGAAPAKTYEKITTAGLNGSSLNDSNKRKSSRDNERTDRNDRTDRGEKDKCDKKDHRKREHSGDAMIDAERKRSKSDETKNKEKKSSQSSSSASSSSKRSSKKHDSSRNNSTINEEYSPSTNNGRDSLPNSSSNKHRSEENRRVDDRKRYS